ncbi:hypothetical protein QFC20_006401 [Naganishia adeliensis]|uniref:Uncharacterized protein n=1 Tax=Naganishia adeliensis TaxID=92952 RepID=A0ACC2VBU7_9TREE|nr:hypothetical protein QFC20_006401 [Naganishia adeliensis]
MPTGVKGTSDFHRCSDSPFTATDTRSSPSMGTSQTPVSRVKVYDVSTIGLKASWELGGNDLLSCVQAVMQMADIGGIEIRNALCIHNARSQRYDPCLGSRVSSHLARPQLETRIDSASLRRLPTPHDIHGTRSARGVTPIRYHRLGGDAALIEARGRSLVQRSTTIVGVSRSDEAGNNLGMRKGGEFLLRRLCKSNPTLAGVGYAFRIFDPEGALDLKNVSSQLNSILAIVRAFYMLVGRHVPVKDFGPFILTFISDLGNCCWIVQPGASYGAPPTFIETTMTMNDEKVVLHRDHPKLVGDER